MKLWIIVAQDHDAAALLPALLDEGIEAYAVASTAGFLRQGTITLLVAVTAAHEATASQLLLDYAQTRTEVRTAGLSETTADHLAELVPDPLLVTLTGASIFRLPVLRVEHW